MPCPMKQPSWELRAALDAVEARSRGALAGSVKVRLPERPVLSNDAAAEARRRAEYDQFLTRCEVEAAAWNAEVDRWQAERADIAAELFRVRVDALIPSAVQLNADRRDRSDERGWGEGPAAEESGISSRGEDAATNATRRAALQAVDFFSGDAGLAASSVLAAITERQLEIRDRVAEARERILWLREIKLRRRALATLRDETRNAFIARWRRKVAAATKV